MNEWQQRVKGESPAYTEDAFNAAAFSIENLAREISG